MAVTVSVAMAVMVVAFMFGRGPVVVAEVLVLGHQSLPLIAPVHDAVASHSMGVRPAISTRLHNSNVTGAGAAGAG